MAQVVVALELPVAFCMHEVLRRVPREACPAYCALRFRAQDLFAESNSLSGIGGLLHRE